MDGEGADGEGVRAKEGRAMFRDDSVVLIEEWTATMGLAGPPETLNEAMM